MTEDELAALIHRTWLTAVWRSRGYAESPFPPNFANESSEYRTGWRVVAQLVQGMLDTKGAQSQDQLTQ